jgi:hypothetical protein
VLTPSTFVTLVVSADKLVSVATPARVVSAAVIRVVRLEILVVCVVLTLSAEVILVPRLDRELVWLVIVVSAVPTLVVRAVVLLALVAPVLIEDTRPASILAIRAVTLPKVVEIGLETYEPTLASVDWLGFVPKIFSIASTSSWIRLGSAAMTVVTPSTLVVKLAIVLGYEAMILLKPFHRQWL